MYDTWVVGSLRQFFYWLLYLAQGNVSPHFLVCDNVIMKHITPKGHPSQLVLEHSVYGSGVALGRNHFLWYYSLAVFILQ